MSDMAALTMTISPVERHLRIRMFYPRQVGQVDAPPFAFVSHMPVPG